jgi:16S rRNA (adenine(1408)-N(1))-methyltransferase
MICVTGNKTLQVTNQELLDMASKFSAVVLDIGTGDGRFVYKQAKANPNKLVIGIDPSQNQLEIYSKKSLKDHLVNTLFLVGAAEDLLAGISNIANEIYINLPWGSLLMHVAGPSDWLIVRLRDLLKINGSLNITFGYSSDTEPKETERLLLEKLDENYIKEKLVQAYTQNGFAFKTSETITKETLKNHETTWSKKLSFGNTRPLYHLIFFKD